MKRKLLVLAGATCLLMLAGMLLVACSRQAPAPTPAPKAAPAPAQPAPKTTAAPAPAAPKVTPAPAPKPAPAAPALPPKPGLISWANYDVIAASWAQGEAIGAAMSKKFSIKLRMMPLGSGIGRMMAARTKTVDLFVSSFDVINARQGTVDWAVREWGPQPLRLVWQVKSIPIHAPVTKAKSGIKTLADMKGRSVGYVASAPSHIAAIEGALNLAGLTWNDVKKVDFPSTGAAWNAVRDGKIDWYLLNSTSPIAYEMEASPDGIYWIPFPTYQENPKGWDRYRELAPTQFPYLATVGAGLSKQKPVQTVGMVFPAVAAYDWTSADLVYWQVKSLTETFDMYKDVTPAMPGWFIDDCLSVGFGYGPFHEGAVKYFKEVGKWTKEMEAEQEKLVALDKKHQDLWKSVLDEAESKAVPEKDFTKFWLEKRKAAGLK